MSMLTLRKMASENVADADVLLEKWRLALSRGDFTTEQASPIVDALLELRTAACLVSSTAVRQRTKKERV